MTEWLGDPEQSAALLNRIRGTSELDARRQALKRLEGMTSEVRLRLITEPEEAVPFCRQLLADLEASDQLPGLPFDEKWERRRAALEMSLNQFLAQALVEVSAWEEAAAVYERCLNLGAQFQVPEYQADSFVKLGEAYRHAGKLPEARQSFERADMLAQLYGLFSIEVEALYQQAVIAEMENATEAAFTLYEDGLKLSDSQRLYPMSIRFLSQLGQLYQSEGRYELSLQNYQKCLQLLRETDNDQESELIILGQISHICVELQDFQTGIEAALAGLDLSRALNQTSEEESFLTDLARLYGRQRNYPKARQYAEEAIQKAKDNGNPQAVEVAQRLLNKVTQLEAAPTAEPSEAQTGSFDLSGLSQQTAQVYYRRANRYNRQGSLDRAVSAYSRALHIDPNYTAALINRGSVYNAQGDYDRALADYTKAIQLDPNDAVIYFNRGNTYRKRREYDRALADYSEAIRLSPTDPDAYFNRGEVLRRQKFYEKAAIDFQRVIELSAGSDESGAEQARQLLTELPLNLS